MAKKAGNPEQIHDLLYQALETELGGELVYTAALDCTVDADLRKEWQGYLDETKTHQRVLLTVFEELGLDPDAAVPSRAVVKHHGKASWPPSSSPNRKATRTRPNWWPRNAWCWPKPRITRTGN